MAASNSPIISPAHLQDLLKAKQLEINSLLELTQEINDNRNADQLFGIYKFTLRALYQVNSMLVFYKDADWEILYKDGVADEDIRGLKVTDEWADFTDITPLDEVDIKAPDYLKWVVPVKHKDSFLAFILLSDFQEGYATDYHSDRFVRTITNIIIVAIENKRLFKKQLEQAKLQREMELASNVQSMLVPSELPKIEGIDVAAFYAPHAQVGGDYYDFFPINDEEYLFCVADVSGKNVSAALLMANFQATLRASAEMRYELPKLVRYLNKRVFELTEGERFVTMLLGIYHKPTMVLNYVNAGHPPLLHLSKGQLNELYDGCMMLGASQKIPNLDEGHVKLRKGDVLAIYTDGFSDMENNEGQIFSIEEKLVESYAADKNAQAIMDSIIRESEQFENMQSRMDDRTAMVIKIP